MSRLPFDTYRDKIRNNGVLTIAVDGNIGVGKTSLARLLSRHLSARLIEENVEDNPFVERFYDDMQTYAIQTQLVFLVNRYREQLALSQTDLFSELTVVDYIFARDKIFANVTLSDEELGLYNRIAAELQANLASPDLAIYLQASTEVLYQRIQSRGKRAERGISKEYLQVLNEAFNHFFFNYEESPLLVVNTDAMDFVHNEEHLADLIRRVSEPVNGMEMYVPTWSE